MAKIYEWSPTVRAAIGALPPLLSPPFWQAVEGHGQGSPPLPPEVLAYLVRETYARGEHAMAERVFAVLLERCGRYVIAWARDFQGRLYGAQTAEDVLVEVFTLLWNRLIAAKGATFYEACFMRGLKRLTQDKLFRLPDEPTVSITMSQDEGEDEQQDIADHAATDPHEHAERLEWQADLRQELAQRLHERPASIQRTAWLLMQGRGEGEIARELRVSTRMVTNYKAALRALLADLAETSAEPAHARSRGQETNETISPTQGRLPGGIS